MGRDENLNRRLTYIPPADLHLHWEAVREGLLKVLEHTAENWLPEDVYCALKNNQATLHMDGKGFAILKQETHFDGVGVHIWCAYSEGLQKLPVYIEEIREMARSIGAKRITLSSKRDWSKYFKPAMTIYEEELCQDQKAAERPSRRTSLQTT